MLESRNHASIVSIYGGNAETDSLASVVGGRPKGSRNKLSEEFFQDLYDVWQAFGKPALETMAMLYPAEFVRLIASLLPKEPEATTTPVIKHMSDAQLDAMIARCIEGDLDPTNDG